jgi:hypothetical protein
MAGLVPAIHVLCTALTDRPRRAGWVYIMTDERNGTLSTWKVRADLYASLLS